MDNKSLKGKRKKKRNLCPNPLFVQWLTEWRDEAAEKGVKSQYCYRKALASLKKYPLVFTSGKECKVLENFGDKICKMLDARLAKHVAEHGNEMPESLGDDVSSLPCKVSRPRPTPVSQALPTSLNIHSVSDSDEDPSLPQPKSRRQSSGEYIPAYRSGPYAILLTLYNNYQSSSNRGYMTKADLIREAQHLSDKSFTMPDAGCRYTAWSSMGTLTRKGLVMKESSPARYSLTQTGCDLAHKLREVHERGTTFGAPLSPPVMPSPSPAVSSSSTDQVTSRYGSFTAGPDLPRLPILSGEITSGLQNWSDDRLQYWYVTESGSKTVEKNKASVTVDDSFGIGFLITCNYQDLIKSGKKYKLDISRPLSDDKIFAYLEDSSADDLANTPPENVQNKTSSAVREMSTVAPEKRGGVQNHSAKVDHRVSEKTSQSVAKLSSVEPVSGTEGLSLSERLGLGVKPAHSGTTAATLPRPVERNTPTDSLPKFSFQPGTFDILLCVDNQEFYGKTSSGGKMLLADLLKNGVNCEVRKLHVGDFAWVARERTLSRPGQLKQTEARELVLDHIIERKRMDDLVSSCIDGRFKEQKFRLNRCGLRCPMYLIEDYGSVQNFSMPEDRLKQTIANTQVVDGFQVKRTGDNKESVAFLTLMTRYLQSHYQDKTLDAYPADILPDVSGPYNIKDQRQQLMEFREFNEASVKTKNLSIREMFGKQIIQMYRLSAEGAKGILDLYPTPSSLIAAYDACCTEKEKEEMLSKIKAGKAGRCLGMAVSRQFYNLYCTNQPLT